MRFPVLNGRKPLLMPRLSGRVSGGRNFIRNSTMAGAAAGTPGTYPTNWGPNAIFSTYGTIVGIGVEDGINYIEIRLVGTATTNGGLSFEVAEYIQAAVGQQWKSSFYMKLVGGSYVNVTTSHRVRENAGAGGLTNHDGGAFIATSSALSTQLYSYTVALDQPTVNNIFSALFVSVAGAFDITLRLGLPRLVRVG